MSLFCLVHGRGQNAATELLGVEAIELPGGHCPYLSRPAHLAEILTNILD